MLGCPLTLKRELLSIGWTTQFVKVRAVDGGKHWLGSQAELAFSRCPKPCPNTHTHTHTHTHTPLGKADHFFQREISCLLKSTL